ncbi:MAG: O-antigen ligase family protein [Micavibrio sp.]
MTQNKIILPAALWLLAFSASLFTASAWQLQLFSLCVLAMFGWALMLLGQKLKDGWEIARSPVLWFAGAFWLLVMASILWSEVKPVSLMAACYFSVFPLTFFTLVIAGSPELFRKLACVLAYIIGALALWAVIQFFFLNTYFMGQARHPLNDPSSLGAVFSMALFGAFGWIVLAKEKRERGAAIILACLVLCGMMATVARGPVFAALPALALFVWLLWPRVKAHGRSFMMVALCGLAFYGVMQTGAHKRYDLGERLFGTMRFYEGDVSNNRLNIWRGAAEIVKERPWLGTGTGTFFLYYPEHRKAEEHTGALLVHNDPLQFWVELGILGPLLFYGFVLAALARTWRALKASAAQKEEEPESANRIILVTCFTALAAMVAHSHVSFNHYNIMMLMLSGFALAVWFLTAGELLKEQKKRLELPAFLSPPAAKILLAAPFALLAWLYTGIVAGEYFVNRARDDLFKEQMFEFAENINAAGRVSNGMNYRAYLLAVNVPLAILEHNTPKLSAEHQRNLYGQVVSYMDAVERLNPRDPSALYYRALVQTMVDEGVVPDGTKPPEDYYREAIKRDPAYLGARMGLYRLLRAQGADEQSLLAVMEGGAGFLYTLPIAAEYYGELGRLYLYEGSYGKAQEVMAKGHEFRQRSDFSRVRLNTPIPQALIGGDGIFHGAPPE